MKKIILVLSVAAISGLTPAIANEGPGDNRAEAAFTKQFSGAENVKWSGLDNNFKRVSFTLGGIRAEAYFNNDGELLGTVRNLFFSQLPLKVIQSVNNRFEGAVIVEVKEIANEEGTSYRVAFEYKNKKYNLKLNSMGEVMELQKEKLKK